MTLVSDGRKLRTRGFSDFGRVVVRAVIDDDQFGINAALFEISQDPPYRIAEPILLFKGGNHYGNIWFHWTKGNVKFLRGKSKSGYIAAM